MKNPSIPCFIAILILAAGCGKKSSDSPTTSSPAQNSVSSSSAAQPALIAWQQGDQAAAVSNFVATDWSAHPLFASDTTLNLSEDQFNALPMADRTAKSEELLAQLKSLKELAQAVVKSGRDAAANGDSARAKKCFTALKQAGAALQGPDCTQLLQMVGKAFEKMADTESAKISQ